MQITIEVLGERQINRELLRVGERATDARPALSAIADQLMTETAEQFASEGHHASGGWAPLAPSTVRSKEAAGFGSRGILERTLRLERSLTERGDPDQILDVSADELTFGTRVTYGVYHQLGRGVPRRRPVELTEEAKVRIVKTLQRWLVTGELA